jgi:hypothetical protein
VKRAFKWSNGNLVEAGVRVMRVDVTGTRSALGVARFGQHLDGKGLDDVERGGKEDCLVLSNPVLAAEDPVKKATGRKRMALVRSTLRCQILGSSSSPSASSKRLEPNIEKAHTSLSSPGVQVLAPAP